MNEGDSIAMEEKVAFTCPFCGQRVTAGEATNQSGESEPAVLHGLPPCEKYLDLEPDEFLRQVRAKLLPLSFS